MALAIDVSKYFTTSGDSITAAADQDPIQDQSARDAFLHCLNCHTGLCQALSKSLANRLHDQHVALSTFSTPEELGNVGQHLGYLILHTRPDLSAACNKQARRFIKPTPEHTSHAERTLRYLPYTKEYNLTLSFGAEGLNPKGYTDSAFADETLDSRSTSAYLFTLNGNPMSWATSLQKLIFISSCEAEYVGLTEGVKEALWVHFFSN